MTFLCSGRALWELSLHLHVAFRDPPGSCLMKDAQQAREAQFYSMFLFT